MPIRVPALVVAFLQVSKRTWIRQHSACQVDWLWGQEGNGRTLECGHGRQTRPAAIHYVRLDCRCRLARRRPLSGLPRHRADRAGSGLAWQRSARLVRLPRPLPLHPPPLDRQCDLRALRASSDLTTGGACSRRPVLHPVVRRRAALANLPRGPGCGPFPGNGRR